MPYSYYADDINKDNTEKIEFLKKKKKKRMEKKKHLCDRVRHFSFNMYLFIFMKVN